MQAKLTHVRLLHQWLIGGIVLCGMAACGKGDFLAEQKFSNDCWPLSDTLAFVYQNPGAEATFLPSVSVDFREEYSYQNLHLKLIVVSPSGKREEVLLEGEAIDEAGNWRVEQQGSSYAAEYPFAKALTLHEKGAYTMQLIHNMRDTSLCQIRWVGIKVK